MKILKEFEEFAIKGNVVDMAIGIIIGAAFGKIVSSLVADVIMPPIGLILGNVDFSGLVLTLNVPIGNAKPVEVKYGMFINNVIDFVIVAFAMFMIVKQMNRLKRPNAHADPTTKECPYCLMTIPIKATRCGHCTSEINDEASKDETVPVSSQSVSA